MRRALGSSSAAFVSACLLSACLITGCRKADTQATPESIESAGASATGETKPAEISKDRGAKRIVVLGTSLTAGFGLDPDDAWPSVLQKKVDSLGLHFEIVNAGLSGETSAGALRRVEWVLDEPAAAVVLEVGANDGLRGVDPDSTEANLVAIIRRVRELRPEARVFLVQMEVPRNLGAQYTKAFHQAYAAAAASERVVLLPFLLDGVAGVPALNQNDGIHPNEAGALRVGENMWNALRGSLEEMAGR